MSTRTTAPTVVRGLTKRYGDVTAVDDVSFEVPPGSVFAFLGTNGAGKSTTIGALTTVIAPDAGSLEVAGHDVRTEGDAVRRAIGVVFQDSLLDSALTVRENLTVRARPYLGQAAAIRERIDRLEDIIDLREFADRRYGRLSGGRGVAPTSPGPCCTTPRSCSSTSRRRASIPRAGRWCGARSTTCANAPV